MSSLLLGHKSIIKTINISPELFLRFNILITQPAENLLRVCFTSKTLIDRVRTDPWKPVMNVWDFTTHPALSICPIELMAFGRSSAWRVVYLWGKTKESCSRWNQMSYSLPLSVLLPLSLTLPSLPPGLLSITQTYNHPSARWTCPYITPSAGWQCQL